MKITRLLVRLEAEHDWIEPRRWAAMCDLEELIDKAIKDGVFDQGDPTGVGKNVIGVGVNQTRPRTPRIGGQAVQAGFVLEENPFEPGTPQHARWAKSWHEYFGLALREE